MTETSQEQKQKMIEEVRDIMVRNEKLVSKDFSELTEEQRLKVSGDKKRLVDLLTELAQGERISSRLLEESGTNPAEFTKLITYGESPESFPSEATSPGRVLLARVRTSLRKLGVKI